MRFLPNVYPGSLGDRGILLAIAIGCSACQVASTAAQSAFSRKQLAVDTLTTIESREYRGIVVHQSRHQGYIMVADRDWFRSSWPAHFREYSQQEQTAGVAAIQSILNDLSVWIKERTDDPILLSFLKEERGRLQAELQDYDPSSKRFVILQFPFHEVREATLQTPDRHRIAATAWQHQIDGVSTRTADSLGRELDRKGIKADDLTFDFSDDLPVLTPTAEQLAARRAIVEYNLREPLEFQGTHEILVRKTSGQVMPLGALLKPMIRGGQSINDLLQELDLPEGREEVIQQNIENQRDKSLSQAIGQAEADGICGVLITRMNQDFSSPVVTVECEFYAMAQPGTWLKVARFLGQSNTADQQTEHLEAIQEDPQVQQVLQMANALGVADQTMVQQAIRYGAATRQATAEAQKKFLLFSNRYTDRLDSPPLFPIQP